MTAPSANNQAEMYLAKMILTQAEKYKLFRKNPKFWNSAVSTKPTGAICESKKKEFKSSNLNGKIHIMSYDSKIKMIIFF